MEVERVAATVERIPPRLWRSPRKMHLQGALKLAGAVPAVDEVRVTIDERRRNQATVK